MRHALITTAALGLAAMGANAQNLLNNGSFEVPGPGFLLFDSYQNFGNVFADASIEVPALDGTTSAKMFGATSGLQSDQVLLQDVPGIVAGNVYTLSGSIWNPSGDEIGPENIIIFQMNFRDASGASIEIAEVQVDFMNEPLDTWNAQEVMAIAPAGSDSMTVALLHIQLGDDQGQPVQLGGASFWDNIMLVEGEDMSCNNPADFNNDGALNFLDISAFLNAFGQGCN